MPLEEQVMDDPMCRDDLDDVVNSVITRDQFPDDDEVTLLARKWKWYSMLQRFQAYGHCSTGNKVSILEGGDAGFPAMLKEIENAQRRVWCESYIFDSSPVGEMFFRSFLAAKQRGCDVILLVDYLGAFTLRSDWVAELRAAGADVVFFNPVLPSSSCVGPVSFRDHRKTMICDDVGFCGGMNIHEEVGEEKYGTNQFYDVHAMLQGPCVADLAEVFRDSLREAAAGVHRDPMPPPPHLHHGVYVQILQSNVRQRRRTLQLTIEQALESADERVLVTTAYFFPPGFLRRALMGVTSRGVRLSLLLSGSSDFYPLPGDLMAQTHFLRNFLVKTRTATSDVSVSLYAQRHMHAKYMTIDGVFSTIGSFNFDLYSARRNLEVGISVFDRDVSAQLQKLHERRASEAKRTSLGDWMYHNPIARAACWMAYVSVRLSGRNLFDGLDTYQRKWLVRKAALTFLLEEQAAQLVATSMMWGLQ